MDIRTTEKAIHEVKEYFAKHLSEKLQLMKVSAPLFVGKGTGINDDLNGIEQPVSFLMKDMDHTRAEIVHSLAKWKRLRLKQLEIPAGEGLYTNMLALRPDEVLSPIHSVFVDQWDWEKHIRPQDRTLEYLKTTVSMIYEAIKATEKHICRIFPQIKSELPEKITFIHTEDLLKEYPALSPKERETAVTKKYDAVFLIGIGGKLSHGEAHDGRAPDYDDWSTPTSDTHKGLNGDILVYNKVLDSAFEISSMGIRVDKTALQTQLTLADCKERSELYFHKLLLDDRLTESIGGGIGQSRLCMYLLRKKHIGEVQVSLWPEELKEECIKKEIQLL